MCETCGGHGAATAPAPPGAHDHGGGTRVVVVGKGGVGKSTLSAVLARQLARGGWRVVAVDADEQRNLAATLGMSLADSSSIVPVAEDADYVHEKTGARPGEGAGGLLVLNPDTTDLIDRLSVQAPDGVRLVVMGGVREAGRGCLCPETALISSAVAGMHLHDEDVVVMDTHAGVEHFGRALARGFDSVVVVVEPTFNSVQVGVDSAALAHELGIATVHLVINRVRTERDLGRVLGYVDQLGAPQFDSVTQVPYDEMVLINEPAVDALLEGSALAEAVGVLSTHVLASASRVSVSVS
jgi:CO dehydrogenase maturation factor